MSHFAANVYAVVRVKLIGADGLSINSLAENSAEAVASTPSEWFTPKLGKVSFNGLSCDVEHVEFADEINWVLVDEIDDASGKILKEHHFDHTLSPMTNLSGHKTALEESLKAECASLEAEKQNLVSQRDAAYDLLKSTVEAIEARVNGVFDHPALTAFGPLLASSEEDCIRIAQSAFNEITAS